MSFMNFLLKFFFIVLLKWGAVGQLSGGLWELVGAFGRFLVGLAGLKQPSPVSFGQMGS